MLPPSHCVFLRSLVRKGKRLLRPRTSPIKLRLRWTPSRVSRHRGKYKWLLQCFYNHSRINTSLGKDVMVQWASVGVGVFKINNVLTSTRLPGPRGELLLAQDPASAQASPPGPTVRIAGGGSRADSDGAVLTPARARPAALAIRVRVTVTVTFRPPAAMAAARLSRSDSVAMTEIRLRANSDTRVL